MRVPFIGIRGSFFIFGYIVSSNAMEDAGRIHVNLLRASPLHCHDCMYGHGQVGRHECTMNQNENDSIGIVKRIGPPCQDVTSAWWTIG